MCQTLITYYSCNCRADTFSLPCDKPTADCSRLSKTCVVEHLQEACRKHPAYHNHPAFRVEKETDKHDWTIRPTRAALNPVAEITDKMHKINVKDVPVHNNGRGYNGSLGNSRKCATLSAPPSIPGRAYRATTVASVKTAQAQKAKVIPPPSSRGAPVKVGPGLANSKLAPAPLNITKKKAVVTMLGNVSPAPGMSKYADRPLPQLPQSQAIRSLRRTQSRNQVLATRADEILSAAQKGHTTKAPALNASRPKIYAGRDVVDYHLTQGRVKRFDPNASSLRTLAAHSAALTRHNQEASRKRLDAARRALSKYGSKKCYDSKEFRALTREELKFIQFEVANKKTIGKTCVVPGLPSRDPSKTTLSGGRRASKKSGSFCTVM